MFQRSYFFPLLIMFDGENTGGMPEAPAVPTEPAPAAPTEPAPQAPAPETPETPAQ